MKVYLEGEELISFFNHCRLLSVSIYNTQPPWKTHCCHLLSNVAMFFEFLFFFFYRILSLGLELNKSTHSLTKMAILLVGQRVGSLGHRVPITVLWVLVMCLDVISWKLTTVLACMLE